jgi:putative FmdB family regulatory protein
MPVYEYACSKCGKHIEIIARITEERKAPLCVEPGCEGQQEMQYVFAPAAIHFKGSGWTPKFHGGED